MPRELDANPNVLDLEYAVRGPLPERAAEMAREGRATLPCNIGNPQAFGQHPLTFPRQVLSLLEHPALLGRERRLRGLAAAGNPALAPELLYSEGVLARAEALLAGLRTGLGAYTDSTGSPFVREAVARFIDARDGVTAGAGKPADPDSIFLTTGASEGVMSLIELLVSGPRDGIMIPIPQYPLYAAAIRRVGGAQINYYLDEDAGWTLGRPALEEAYQGALRQGVHPKAIVVINPSNPTGAVLPETSVAEVIAFAEAHGLMIIADEVYQENTYGAPFYSFARALGHRDVALASLHSVSKGFLGECGRRGGYLELRNPPTARGRDVSFAALFKKRASVSLCSSTTGQAMVHVMVTPPETGTLERALYDKERAEVLTDLHAKATAIREAFREMRGVECFGRTGAMYLFPRLTSLPAGTTDFDYCMALLEKTGLCTVNGSGFGQAAGTAHLRIAFLPDRALLERVLPEWIAFHNAYVP